MELVAADASNRIFDEYDVDIVSTEIIQHPESDKDHDQSIEK